MKTKEQAKLSLESNEIILKGQLAKLKELEIELHSLRYNVDYTKGEIAKNKTILNGLSLDEIESISNSVLNKIFNPNLEIFTQVWSEDDGENEEDDCVFVQIVKGIEYEDVMAYTKIQWYPTEKHLKEVLENMIVEEVIPDLIRKG